MVHSGETALHNMTEYAIPSKYRQFVKSSQIESALKHLKHLRVHMHIGCIDLKLLHGL